MSTPDTFSRLLKTKEEKIANLSEKTFASEDLSRGTYTDLGSGYIDHNSNKIWNISENWTPEEMSFARDYLVSNYSLPDSSRKDRRLYEYGVSDVGRDIDPLQAYQPENYDPRKVGLASGRYDTSDRRYIPGSDGYGWEAGTHGVDVSKKHLDSNLSYDAATALEALIHSNRGNLDQRLVKQRDDGWYDYASPEGMKVISKTEKDALFGSGASEYYFSHEGIFGDGYDPTSIDQDKIIQGLEQAMGVVRGGNDPITTPSGTSVTGRRPVASDYITPTSSLGNTLSGFGASFVNELLINPADAIGDWTGLYDIGTAEEKEKMTQGWFGYDPRVAAQAMEEIGKQWDIVASGDASVSDRMRAAGTGIIEAFTTPEMLGTSFGTLLAWVSPGKFLNLLGVGTKFDKTVRGIDAAVKAGTKTKAVARAEKAKAFMSLDGAKSFLTSQAGMVTSAMGNVNNQYEEFIENNNGIELEGAEKAKWFAGRFAVQMVNQNLDKIVDFSVMKNPGVITAIIPAVKSMTNKEFANVAKSMGKGILKTTENMGKESAQEYAQTMMELFNSRYGAAQFEDVNAFTDFITDERNTRESGIAALAGAGGATQFEAVGAVGRAAGKVTGKSLSELSKAGGKLGEKIKSTKPIKEEELPLVDTALSVEEVATATEASDKTADETAFKYASMFGEKEAIGISESQDLEDQAIVETPTLDEALSTSGMSYADVVSEIESAESVIEGRRDSPRSRDSDDLALRMLRKAKSQAAKTIMESKEPPTLGSGYSPEDVAEDFVMSKVSVEGTLDITEEEINLVNEYLRKNGQKPYRFDRVRSMLEGKDASEVYQDSMGTGTNSAPNRRARLRTLVNTPGVNKQRVENELKGINNFLTTQKDRRKQYEATRKEVQADIDNYNKNKNRAGADILPPKSKDVAGLDGKNFINVSKGSDGNYKIHKSSQAILDSLDDTIDHLETTLARYKKATTRILGEETVDTTHIAVPVSTSVPKKVQGYREEDKKFYDAHKPTKAIVDEETSPEQWKNGKDYQVLNESKIAKASTEFTADDVVLLTTLKVKKGSTASKTLSKAIKAGATIVVDRALHKGNTVVMRNLAKRYGAGVTTVDGKVVWRPREEALERQKEAHNTTAQKNRKARILKKLVNAFDAKLTAKAEGTKLSKEDSDKFDKAVELAKQYFDGPNAVKNMRDHAVNELNKEAAGLQKKLGKIMLIEGTSSKAYSEELGKATKTAARLADKQIKIDEARLTKGGTLVSEWKEAEADAKKGGTPLVQWVKDTFGAGARAVATKMLSDSLGKAKNPESTIYSYRKKGSTTYSTTKYIKDVKAFSEDGVYHVIEVDPSTYVEVSKPTVLNTLDVTELKLGGEQNVLFNDFVEESLDVLKSVLGKLDFEGKVLPFPLIDSPAASLIFNDKEELNANFAVAARVALYNFVRNNAYLMSKGMKSAKEIAEILGKHESELSYDAISLMQDKGLLYKTAADSIGKDVANLLGLSAKNNPEVDAQAYNALVTEFGQIAMAMGTGKKEGLLKTSSMPSKDFATKILGKTSVDMSGGEATVNFIEIQDQDTVAAASFIIDSLNKTLPGIDVRRKEPSFVELTDKEKKAATKKIRKERLGLNVASKSAESMNTLMDTEMSADMPLIRFALKEGNLERIKKLLGFIEIDSDEYKKLSYKEQQTQASKNRDVEKSIEHLTWLNDQTDSATGKVSMWFKYFFSKNGRFFVDSNTLNPQTDKFHRFMIQPLSHLNTYAVKKGKFFIGDKDVTDSVHYALAQGFGFATDKKSKSEINAFSKNILDNMKSVKELNKIREEFLNKGEVKSLGIEIEHLGHALQAFDFVEKMITAKGKTFDSPITAEFDAVTSGFALKLLQMPIIGKKLYEWLGKVGIFTKDNENLSKAEGVSMNNILSLDGFLDSYQFLANSVKPVKYKDVQKHSSSPLLKSKEGYAKDLWDAVSKVLPTVDPDGGISSDLRNLFKYPFMTFNYASSIKSIRTRLKGTMKDDIAKKIAKLDLTKSEFKDSEQSLIDMMKVYAETDTIKDLEALQELVRTKDMDYVKVGKGGSLGHYLDAMIDASYGVQVETILNDEFAPFVAAQDTINDSFKAMFEVFFVSYEQALKKARTEGPVSSQKEKEIYESLKNQWPAIKGPLSAMEDEFSADGSIGVYSTETASPYGIHAGRKAPITKLAPGVSKHLTIRTSHMIKVLSAAISAGSVIPIHYVDGAVMSNTIAGMDGNITSIHDAIMPPLLRMAEAQKYYNKATLDISASYSFVDQIVKAMDRVIRNADLFEIGSSYQTTKVKVGRDEEMSVSSFIVSTRNTMAALANEVNESRKSLFDTLNDGAHVMHMAGTSEGIYTVDTNNVVEHVEIDSYEEIQDNSTNVIVDGVTLSDLDVLATDHC